MKHSKTIALNILLVSILYTFIGLMISTSAHATVLENTKPLVEYLTKNPNKIARQNARAIKKGKKVDSLLSMIAIAEVLEHPKLKSKNRKLGISAIKQVYMPTIEASKSIIAKKLTLIYNKSNPVQAYQHYQFITRQLASRKNLAELLHTATVSIANLEEEATLYNELGTFQDRQSEARLVAAEYLYEQGKTIVDNPISTKTEYRIAYHKLSHSLKLETGYKNADSLKTIAQKKGTTTVKLLPPINGKSGAISNQATANAKRSMDIMIERYNRSTPFFRVGWNVPSPDITVKLICEAKVTQQTFDPVTYDEKKTIKEDEKEIEVKATLTKYKKQSFGFVNGIAFIRDKDGMLIEEKKLYGSYSWVDIWSKISGNRKAVRKKRRWLLSETKENPFPKESIMIDLASGHFEDASLSILFKELRQMIR